MYNPLKVSLENIIPLTEARDHFSQIVNEVQKDKLYVLTKGGKPAVAIVDVKYLEHITGGEIKEEHVEAEIQKNPEKVGIPPMIAHEVNKPQPPKPIIPPAPPAPKPEIPKSNPVPPPPMPKPIPTPTPSVQMPEVKPTPVPPPPPKPAPIPPPKAPSPSPAPGQPLKMPEEKIEIQIQPDGDSLKESAKLENSFDTPEDKPGPAQYGGGTNNNNPDDMVID